MSVCIPAYSRFFLFGQKLQSRNSTDRCSVFIFLKTKPVGCVLSIFARCGNIQLMGILHFVSKVAPGEIRRDGSLEKISERSKISRNSARQMHPIGKLDQATPETRCCSNKYSTANQAEKSFSEAGSFLGIR